MLFLTNSWQKIWPSSNKPASIKYFKDHNFMLLTYSKVPIIGSYASSAVHAMYCQNCPKTGTYNRSFRVLISFVRNWFLTQKRLFSSCSIMRRICFLVITNTSLKGPHPNLNEQKKFQFLS